MKPKFGKSVNDYLEEKRKEKHEEELKIKRMKYSVYIIILMFLSGVSFLNLNISREDIGWYIVQLLSTYSLGYFIIKIENLK